jgi:bacillithiol biosynthesis cysteine-adding enzyme BshC
MDCQATYLPYGETGYFSKIILDYLGQDPELKPFYSHPVSLDGVRQAIRDRSAFKTDRPLLVRELKKQYAGLEPSATINRNLELLLLENSFTITTAHQPVLFTGPLFFIYKILHVIRLAEGLSSDFPDNHFIPAYFMGSEDADLDELGHIFLHGEKLLWETREKGAVGRMSTMGIEILISRLEAEFGSQPHGRELVQLISSCYIGSPDVQTATLKLIHALFARFGLIVFIPDNPAFKNAMVPVFEQDIFEHRSSNLVENSIKRLSSHYKVQARPRAINLFYLGDQLRNRIEQSNGRFNVHEADLQFDSVQIRTELHEHPEHFSPNVILRGLMQSTLLPDIAFIGGSGELAYWLELKSLFEYYGVPYPMLILRNSFLLVEGEASRKMRSLELGLPDLFLSEQELLNRLVKKYSQNQLSLNREFTEAEDLYNRIAAISAKVAPSLEQHTRALESKALRRLRDLEAKLLKTEKRKFEDQDRQIHALKSSLFPQNNLQERIDNFIPYYAKWGNEFIDRVYHHSPALDQHFTVLITE